MRFRLAKIVLLLIAVVMFSDAQGALGRTELKESA